MIDNHTMTLSKMTNTLLLPTAKAQLSTSQWQELEQLIKKNNYLKLLTFLTNSNIFNNWQNIIDSKVMALIIANKLNIGVSIKKQQSNNNLIEAFNQIINNNFTTFITAIVASPKFKENNYSLNQMLFLARYCKENYDILCDDSTLTVNDYSLYLKLVVDKILNYFYQERHYCDLQNSDRFTIDNLAILHQYQHVSLACFAELAMDALFIKHNNKVQKLYADRTFTCYDYTDWKIFLNWLSTDQTYHLNLVKNYGNQIYLKSIGQKLMHGHNNKNDIKLYQNIVKYCIN